MGSRSPRRRAFEATGFRSRSGFTAPRRFPCFSMAQRTASRSTAPRFPSGTLWERRHARVSRSSLRARSMVTRIDHWSAEMGSRVGRLGALGGGASANGSGSTAGASGGDLVSPGGAWVRSPPSRAWSGFRAGPDRRGAGSGSFRIPSLGARRGSSVATRYLVSSSVLQAARATISSWFSWVRTGRRVTAVVRESRPSLSGASSLGNSRRTRIAPMRRPAAPSRSASSRRQKLHREP